MGKLESFVASGTRLRKKSRPREAFDGIRSSHSLHKAWVSQAWRVSARRGIAGAHAAGRRRAAGARARARSIAWRAAAKALRRRQAQAALAFARQRGQQGARGVRAFWGAGCSRSLGSAGLWACAARGAVRGSRRAAAEACGGHGGAHGFERRVRHEKMCPRKAFSRADFYQTTAHPAYIDDRTSCRTY